MYSPVRVSIFKSSPMLMNDGALISAPRFEFAHLRHIGAVLPRAPGSQYSTRKITWFGGEQMIGWP